MKGFDHIATRLLIGVVLVCAAATATAATTGIAEARGDLLTMRTPAPAGRGDNGTLFQDVGGTAGSVGGRFRADVAAPMLLSLLMPGLGEASMGYKRGYLMMAFDIASWISARRAHNRGGEIRDEYFLYADTHWELAKLRSEFGDNLDQYDGTYYYGVSSADSLSLWVSEEDDRREYYENLGKWDQFVFGWDDYRDPRNIPGIGLDASAADLSDIRVSAHRESYRTLRIASNNEYSRRDLLIKINMGTRLLSMLQVAWLQGAFSDEDGPASLSLKGHDLTLINETRGLTSGRVGLSLSY